MHISEDLKVQASWESLYIHRGINPQGKQTHRLTTCYTICPRGCSSPSVCRLFQKRGFSSRTQPASRDQSPWLLCSKTYDGSREGRSLGHPGNPPKFKGKAYTVGWGKNLTKVPTASWLLSCLQDRNTPSVNRNSQIFYFCWIGCPEIETKDIWNFIVLLAIIDPQYWLFPSSAEK